MKASKIKKKKSFFKKIFLKLSRLLGYEVMDQGDLSLLSSDGNNENNSLSKIGKSSLTLPMGTVNITRPVKSLDIILRTCVSIKMLTKSKERIFEKEKSEYTLRCLKSIVNSINYSKDELKNIWSEIYRAHLRDCEIYFKDRKDDFLKFNIDIDGPNELYEFLKASYPNLDKNKWKFIK